jgi:hypothetical protein
MRNAEGGTRKTEWGTDAEGGRRKGEKTRNALSGGAACVEIVCDDVFNAVI